MKIKKKVVNIHLKCMSSIRKKFLERISTCWLIQRGWNSQKIQWSLQHMRKKKSRSRLRIMRGCRIGNGTKNYGQMSKLFSFLIIWDDYTNLGQSILNLYCSVLKVKHFGSSVILWGWEREREREREKERKRERERERKRERKRERYYDRLLW